HTSLTDIYTLSLHDALPILSAAEGSSITADSAVQESPHLSSLRTAYCEDFGWRFGWRPLSLLLIGLLDSPAERMTSIWDSLHVRDRKSTRLNSSHLVISYAV